MIQQLKRFAFLMVLLVPAVVAAHPGHGATNGQSLVHYLAEPEHALPPIGLLIAGLVVVGVYRLRRRG